MKKLLSAFFAITISSGLLASEPTTLNWTELELFNTYSLNQNVTFENGVALNAREEYEMVDFYSLGVPVIYLEFQKLDCKGNEATADLSLVSVSGSTTVIGAKSEESCQLGLFVDLADIYTQSIFSK